MNTTTLQILTGPAGQIDIRLDSPANTPIGIVWLGHPHPLFGGTRDNKVVQTLNRAFLSLGYCTVLPNFRGVGKSDGTFDNGIGELQDAILTLRWMQQQWQLPLVLAGFSFGSVIAAQLNAHCQTEQLKVDQIVLVGTAVGRWSVPPVAPTSLIIHGQLDDVITLAQVEQWAWPLGINVSVIADTGHFFHGKLNQLKNLVFKHWGRSDLVVPEQA
jgi:uncharacterized protein